MARIQLMFRTGPSCDFNHTDNEKENRIAESFICFKRLFYHG